MRTEARFLVWLGLGAAFSILTAGNFLGLLNQSLGDAFGDVFPAVPFAVLLTVIFALRWKELRNLLAKERGISSQPASRVLGLAMLAALVALQPLTKGSVVTAGTAFVLTFYAASLLVNPLARRFLLPYGAILSAGLVAPALVQSALGEPLVYFSSTLSSGLVALLGFPVSWQGPQFQLVSKTGDVITGVVTPGCSSAISVTTFLGLLALMHLDLKKDLRSTTVLALTGVAVLTLLNSVRISLLMWVGYVEGAAAFWGIHNWIGYALFLGFYFMVLPIYSRLGEPPFERNAASLTDQDSLIEFSQA